MPCTVVPDPDAAARLLASAVAFRDAVSARQSSTTAADRFYRDLTVYQWRLEALEARLADANAVACSGDDSEPEVATPEARRRLKSLDGSLKSIEEQCSIAVSALEERAAHYAVGLPGATGRLESLAATEAERRRAMQHLRELAEATYEEIADEAREILEVPGADGLRSLCATLERRREFWRGQFEETWTTWQQATCAMYDAGEKACAAWRDLATSTAALPPAPEAPAQLPGATVKALARGVACVMAVDFWCAVGLAGLQPDCVEDAERQPEEGSGADQASGPGARLSTLAPAVAWLSDAPAGRLALATAVQAEATSLCGASLAAPSALEVYRPLLVDVFAYQLSSAAACGDGCLCCELLKFSVDRLSDSVAIEVKDSRNARGRRAHEEADAAGHRVLGQLLEEWSVSAPAKCSRAIQPGDAEGAGWWPEDAEQDTALDGDEERALKAGGRRPSYVLAISEWFGGLL